MRVLRVSNKLRQGSNPFYNYSNRLFQFSDVTNPQIPIYHVTSSTGYLLFLQKICSITSKNSSLKSISDGPHSFCQSAINFVASNRCLSFSYSSQFSRYNSSSLSSSNLDQRAESTVDINRIINVVKCDEIDLESILNSIASNLSKSCLIEVLHCLNLSKVSAVRFFTWLKNAQPTHCRNSDICSLVFANCGLLEDYTSMLSLLKDFRNKEICLSEKAFSFLPISSTSMDMAKRYINQFINLLTEVGGSCSNSGIHSLIEMLCSLNSIELAKHVMAITEEKVSYYNIFVKHMCMRGQFGDARKLLEEMRQMSCGPEARTYNYLISGLCKLGGIDEALSILPEMLHGSCSPNLLTFEILIQFACKYGRSDEVIMLENEMVNRGLKPRLSTHYAFIRGYFHSQQFEKTYRYVKNTAAMHRCLAKDIYNVLASLHLKHGDILVAHNLLVEMLGIGIKPKYSIYRGATSHLCKIGKANLAENLRVQYYSHNIP